MTILTKAGKDYKCNACKTVIAKGSKHLAKPRFQYGTDRFCVNCIMRELRDMVCEEKEKEATIAELERDHEEGNL
jgi:hypothetical protein